jgi:AcrR family transcriptional regulator
MTTTIAPPAVPTRQRLINAAKARFYREGFRNVGIDAILDDVGITKTAFYKHFESKDDLMVAVLQDLDRFFLQTFRDMVRDHGGPSAAGQLRAILEVVQMVIADPTFHGCIFIHAVMEFPLAHDPANKAAVRHKRAIEDLIYELAERAGADDPKAMAEELCMLIEGAYITRSVTRDPATINVARRIAEQIITRHLPGT